MSDLELMVSIVERPRVTEYIERFQEHGVPVDLLVRGYGTANNEMQELFGLEHRDSEKAIVFSVVTGKTWRAIKKDLESSVGAKEPWAGLPYVNSPWSGVLFTVPMSSVGGMRELSYLTRGQDFKKGEESTLKNTIYELLVVITNVGYTEQVMDAARGAGASGGTIIHARGTSKNDSEEFLGITLASERDMVFIVTTKEEKNDIMTAIMKNAGLDTKAKSVVFSLPVTATSGFKITKDRIEKKAKQKASSKKEKA